MKKSPFSIILAVCLLLLAGCRTPEPVPAEIPDTPNAGTNASESPMETPEETEPETEAETAPKALEIHYPESFAVSDYDLDDVRCIGITSCTTWDTLFLRGHYGKEAILKAVQPLKGENPTSSREYYGGAYVLSFYGDYEGYEGIPQKTDTPMLELWIIEDSSVVLDSTVYEIFGKFSYPAMYTIDPEVGRALIAACREYIE